MLQRLRDLARRHSKEVVVPLTVSWVGWVSSTLFRLTEDVAVIRDKLVGVQFQRHPETKSEESMGAKSYFVHYKNKYPGGHIFQGESSMDVYCKEGRHRVALRKNGAGQWVDASEELGCEDRHDLSPIPKDARAFKLFKDGKVGKAEEHADRAPQGHKYADENDGKVPSIEEHAEMEKQKAEKARSLPAPSSQPQLPAPGGETA